MADNQLLLNNGVGGDNDIFVYTGGEHQTLPNIRIIEKTGTILWWFDSVLQRMEHYKSEHQTLLKEAMALLELALWKAKIEENVVDNTATSSA